MIFRISRMRGAKSLSACAILAEFAVIFAFIALAVGCEQPRPDLPPRRRVVLPTATAEPSQPAPESAAVVSETPSASDAAPATTPGESAPAEASAETPAESATPAPETPAISAPAAIAPTPGPNAASTPAASAPAVIATPAPDPDADPAAALADAIAAMKGLPSYRVDMEHAMSITGVQGETKTEIQADVQAPDKMGGSMTISLGGQPPVAMRFVRVGAAEYISPIDPDDPESALWVLGGESAIAPMSDFFAWFADDSPYEIRAAELVGVEDLDGVTTYRLRGAFAVEGAPNDDESMDAEIWVGTADSRIRKMSVAGNVEKTDENGNAVNLGGLEIAAAYSNFADDTIQIAPPASFINGTASSPSTP